MKTRPASDWDDGRDAARVGLLRRMLFEGQRVPDRMEHDEVAAELARRGVAAETAIKWADRYDVWGKPLERQLSLFLAH